MKATTQSNQVNATYTQWSNSSTRIDGAVHNTVIARRGLTFNYRTEQPFEAVEISFANEPYGNMRSILVADMAAARALRDQLNRILGEQA